MNKKTIIAIFLIGIVVMAGCKKVKNGYEASSSASSSSTSGASGGSSSTADSSQGTSSSMPPPASLQKIEVAAVSVLEDLQKENWNDAAIQLATVKTAANEVLPLLASSQVPNLQISSLKDGISKLEQDIKLKKSGDAKKDANQITNSICDILDEFAVKIPTDVNRLGYYVRAIRLDMENNDWISAKMLFDNAKTSWGRLKSMLTNTYQAEIDKTQSILLALGKAIDEKTVANTTSQLSLLSAQLGLIQADFTKMSSASSSGSSSSSSSSSSGSSSSETSSSSESSGSSESSESSQ